VRATVEQAGASRVASQLSLPARASELGLAREYAHQAAASFGFDEEHCYDVACAVNEAVTNAIRHGRPDAQGRIHVSVVDDGDCLTLTVRDYGTFVASAVGATPSSEGGMGFPLMAGLMDTVQLCVSPGSTTVRLSKARV
jgi:stage II sporulation protein AB (anti-sigma F factor)